MRLDGKIGIVTAAASGMGRAGALRFAKEGAKVAVVDRDEAGLRDVCEEIAALGGEAFALAGDLRDTGFAADIVRQAVDRFGALDFLWNHVGYPGPAKVEGLDWAEFDLCIDLNLRSIVATTAAAVPVLRQRGGGAILCTSSASGLVGSPFSPVYSMTKFGVVGFVRSLATRLAPDRIRVNAICPGTVDTPMLRSFVARPDQDSSKGRDPEELVAQHGGKNPFGRAGRPEEIANAALFLLSDEASFVSGVALPVDGAKMA
jgi:NAD(P)-dependent dehydrogenase (short-subunit alcohol dehydrogenase family)